MEDESITTIKLKNSTKDRIERFGNKSESYDEILNAMCEELEKSEFIYRKIRDEAKRG